MHIDDHDRFVPEGIDAESGIADGYSAEGEQRGHPDIVMFYTRPVPAEHGVAHDQSENSRCDSGNQAEPRGASAGGAGNIGDQHDQEERQNVFEHRNKRLHSALSLLENVGRFRFHNLFLSTENRY